jgi:hypothetical protein
VALIIAGECFSLKKNQPQRDAADGGGGKRKRTERTANHADGGKQGAKRKRSLDSRQSPPPRTSKTTIRAAVKPTTWTESWRTLSVIGYVRSCMRRVATTYLLVSLLARSLGRGYNSTKCFGPPC